MDQAKAIINLKEGIVQLEGPVEFVRRYLDLYRPVVRGRAGALQGTASTPKKEVPARTVPPVHRKRAQAKRVSCAGAIRTEIESGFFAEPKSTQEVKQRLVEKGMTCTNNSIRMNLRRLSESGLLAPLKEGRAIRYRRSS
jgi:hypothetical protein